MEHYNLTGTRILQIYIWRYELYLGTSNCTRIIPVIFQEKVDLCLLLFLLLSLGGFRKYSLVEERLVISCFRSQEVPVRIPPDSRNIFNQLL